MIEIGEQMILSNNPVRKKRGWVEGGIVTGRSLFEYELLLGFNAKELEGKKVLNVGAGFSRLERDLEKRGVKCFLVDFDLKDGRKSFAARFDAFLDRLRARPDQFGKKLTELFLLIGKLTGLL